MSSAEPCMVLSGLSDDEWLSVLQKSIKEPSFKGVLLPGFPEEQLQRQFVGSAWEHTLAEASNFYRVVKSYVQKTGRTLVPESRVLDFGCGWGRMARFFLKDVASENLHGVDVDAAIIDLCRKLFSYGRFDVVSPEPPVHAKSNTYDVIFAYSVFSHLAEPVHLKWVEELARVLKPGGVFLATTQGRGFIDFCARLREQANHESGWHKALARSFVDRDAALQDYDAGKFLHSPTGGGDYRPSSFYGETLIPPGYVERVWTKYLKLLDYRDEPQLLPQALIVMTKT